MQDRRVVAERFARSRGRGDHNVSAGEHVIDRLSLMRVKLLDTARLERLGQARVERLGERRIGRGNGRQLSNGRNVEIWRVGTVDRTGREAIERRVERLLPRRLRSKTSCCSQIHASHGPES